MVRLKVLGDYTIGKLYIKFQFQYGTIKRMAGKY